MDFIKVTLKGEDFTFTALDFEQDPGVLELQVVVGPLLVVLVLTEQPLGFVDKPSSSANGRNTAWTTALDALG